MTQRNIQLFAISPQTIEKNRKLIESKNLKFEILRDENNAYSNKLDLMHGFAPELKELYLSFGADLETFNGDPSWTLPIATRILCGGDGEIVSIDYNADYTKRPEPESILELFG